MSFIEFVKEKWLTYTFLFLSLMFAVIIYLLDKSFTMSESNATYVLAGWIVLLVPYVCIDFYLFYARFKKMKAYCSLHGSSNDIDEFTYPVDKAFARQINDIVAEFETFKADIATKSAEDLAFITKWIHDIKLPIAATRLILENNEADLPKKLYENIDMELFAIEQSIQKVFYEIKSNSFFEDYKIASVLTERLIANSLKGFSNFFSYKKLKISVSGKAKNVLTDEKWSSYILTEIISNAVKYTQINGTITINTTCDGNKTTISITNTGMGILPQDIGQVFSKGFTASTNRGMATATGYGMYLSKKLANLLTHELTVESHPGTSCSFHLTFINNDTIYNVTKL